MATVVIGQEGSGVDLEVREEERRRVPKALLNRQWIC
jgi:hypothetical protein